MNGDLPQIEAADPPTITFAEKHIDPIIKGQKTSTIRLDAPDIRIGQRFQLVDEDGDRFASAILRDRGYESIKWIVKLGVEGHRDYDSCEEMIEEFEEYYPDAELTPDTCLDILYWRFDELWE